MSNFMNEEQCHQDEEDNNVGYVDDSQSEYMEMQAMYLDNMLECW